METIEIVGYISMFLTLVFIIACSSMDSLKKMTSNVRRFNLRTIFSLFISCISIYFCSGNLPIMA
ncbi:hypothetical protein [Campylobacter upsaliensis]|uniref:hypothetical protein n=1 Tax=Campylobacter upsaliensis TaxID=28080 RepID=UPI0022EAF831|nr:hypothetical protein [Campylobacter upsaliensis]